MAGVEADRAGRVKVEPDLTVPGHPEIFVIGDTATSRPDGKPVPGIGDGGQAAGKYAATVIRARLEGEHAAPFRYKHPGDIATSARARR